MDEGLGFVVGVVLVVALSYLVLRYWMSRQKMERRRDLLDDRLSAYDWEVLGKKARIVKRAPEVIRRELEGIVEVLMAEKNFEACGGLEEVTDEMKLVIMSQAALLLVGREHAFFPLLKSVLIYPEAYQARGQDGEEQTRLGESWSSGSIVLSWKSVVKGGEDPGDGRNVVLHEFAHQLDQENEGSVGVPVLEGVEDYREWAGAFGPAYEEFVDRVDAGKKTVLDRYGATNPAEFFAVGTETFFEKAKQLHERYPKLYGEMRDYYGVDPLKW